MLIEFKVRNFQCFRDEVALSLIPARADPALLGNIWQGRRYRSLKSVGIFGANASGKTSLLHALFVLRRFAVTSATRMTAGDPIPGIDPFRLATDTRREPSSFEVLVELDGNGYRYRVEATREKVWREKLEHQGAEERSRWVTLIDRDIAQQKTRVVLHERLGNQARRDQIIEDTRGNSLILSRAAERNVEPVLPLFTWLKDRVHHRAAVSGSPPDALFLRAIAALADQDQDYRARLARLVRDADTGVAAVHTELVADQLAGPVIIGEGDVTPEVKDALSGVQAAVRRLFEVAKTEDPVTTRSQFFTEHETAGPQPVRFDLEDESIGTLRYWSLAGRFLELCQESNLIIVDELDNSLHPQLARRIIQLAHSPEFSRSGTQLVFATHDVTLMDPTLLRRDQILLTQKDAAGASELYSLWDFDNMPRNNAALEKNYLAGRFGGVPIFGPSLADITQAEQPTELHAPESHAVGTS